MKPKHKKELTKALLSKMRSRANIGTVPTGKVIPDKRRKKPKYPERED